MIGRYQTARAFRVALEERLRQTAQARRIDVIRLRRQVAFDRLLARLFAEQEPPWLLKGGYTFELRLGSAAARVTRDLDLSIPSLARLTLHDAVASSSHMLIRDSLQDVAERDLQDGFIFRIGMPSNDLDAAPNGGARYPVEARLDARIFTTFHVDVGVGDVLIEPSEWLTGENILDFANIQPTRAAAISCEQQFAEKLHAYTLPRSERMNTRVKDLVDLVLLLALGLPDLERVRQALIATFAQRNTHALTGVLEPPPAAWRDAYTALAIECHMDVTDMDDAFDLVAAYYQTLQVG